MDNPIANMVTDSLHIPGGISTAFSLMFLVIAAELVPLPRCGAMMGMVQGLLALIMGRVGSMGLFMPLGYFLPGVAIDLSLLVFRKSKRCTLEERIILTNMTCAVTASLTANLIVFRLRGPALLLYVSVSASSGFLFGTLGTILAKRLKPILVYSNF